MVGKSETRLTDITLEYFFADNAIFLETLTCDKFVGDSSIKSLSKPKCWFHPHLGMRIEK